MTDDPFQVIANHLGVTPEEVGAMTREQISAALTALRAQLDQLQAAQRDLTQQAPEAQ